MKPITITGFLGASLAEDQLMLAENVGVASLNQRPGFSDMRPWNAPGATLATVPASPQRITIHRMGQDVASDANYWHSWSTRVNVVLGSDPDDTTERTYFTGSGTPKWTDNVIGLSGGAPYPQATRELAVPAPTSALIATLNTEGASGTEQAYSWVYTFVNDLGWESAPSPVSNTLLKKPNSTFDLAGFDSAPGGAYGITTIRLYRFNPGSGTNGDFFFVREWAIGSTPGAPQDDARAAGTDPIATTGWRTPPTDGHGLIKLWNGMLAMMSGKGIRISEPNKPYAYPLAYELALSHTGVAMFTFGQNLVALTTGDAKVFVGSSPEAMDEEPTKINRPCVSAAGVVEFNERTEARGGVWPSEECLCWLGDGGFRNLTDHLMTREQWRALVPSTIVGARYGRFYIGFYNDGGIKGFLIDPLNPTGIYFLETGYRAAYRDPLTEKLYVLDGSLIREWNAGAALTATFKSKLVRLPAAVNLGALQVIARSYPVAVKVWGGGTLRFTGSVTSDSPIRLPPGYKAEEFQFEVASDGRVMALRAAVSMEDLKQA